MASFSLYLHPLWAGKEPEGVHLPGGGLEKVIAESKTYRVYGSMALPPDDADASRLRMPSCGSWPPGRRTPVSRGLRQPPEARFPPCGPRCTCLPP